LTSRSRPGVCREPYAADVSGRLLWLKTILSLGFLSGVLISMRLWTADRFYPTTPVFEGLPSFSGAVDYAGFGALLVLLAAVLFRRSRWPALALLALVILLAALDQSRLQPWVYQYSFMLAALALCRAPGDALDVCRLILAGTYLWSGLQ
jgi:hypothetical protein